VHASSFKKMKNYAQAGVHASSFKKMKNYVAGYSSVFGGFLGFMWLAIARFSKVYVPRF
jgi:hypothetical protein